MITALIGITLGIVVGLIYRNLVRNASLKRVSLGTPAIPEKNIGRIDRLIRAFIGFMLFIFGSMIGGNIIVFALAGFCFFEAIFSWCAFYAAIGRNTCPM